VHAQAPMAIVLPTKGCSFSMNLRDGDISWHDFLEKATDLRYAFLCFFFLFFYIFNFKLELTACFKLHID
jgi:hypothetical protein